MMLLHMLGMGTLILILHGRDLLSCQLQEYNMKTSVPQPEPNVQVRIDYLLQPVFFFLSFKCEELHFIYLG